MERIDGDARRQSDGCRQFRRNRCEARSACVRPAKRCSSHRLRGLRGAICRPRRIVDTRMRVAPSGWTGSYPKRAATRARSLSSSGTSARTPCATLVLESVPMASRRSPLR